MRKQATEYSTDSFMSAALLEALLEIVRQRWLWRGQIVRLGKFELMKQTRNAVFSWVWLIVRPSVSIFCFWVALGLGLRADGGAAAAGLPPYILWLCAGVIPWFFMQSMLGQGADLFRRYRYLVNKINFPLPCITSMFIAATMGVQLMLWVILMGIYFVCGMSVDIYLLQVPVLLALMLIFWDFATLTLSLLAALSRDFRFFVNALNLPFFWLSGVIYHVDNLPFGLNRALKMLNPVTFFISGFRDALYGKTWFFADGPVTAGFAAVFAATALACAWLYARYGREVYDVF